MAASIPSRREFLALASALGITLPLTLQGSKAAFAKGGPAKPPRAIRPHLVKRVRTNASGDGVITPFGEVRVVTHAGETLPIEITAANGAGVMNLAAAKSNVRIGVGTDKSAIVLTSAGIRLGAEALLPWTEKNVERLRKAIAADQLKVGGLLQLRAAFMMGYPAAVRRFKGGTGRRMRKTVRRATRGFGATGLACSTKTEVVQGDPITESIAVIKTAEEQAQECRQRQARTLPCSALPEGVLRDACVWTACALSQFTDLVTGWIDVVVGVAEDVVRTVVACVKSVVPVGQGWPSPWDALSPAIQTSGTPTTDPKVSPVTISSILAILRQQLAFLGPWVMCFFPANDNWSLVELDTRVDVGGGRIAVPYGVRVCISAQCANALTIESQWEGLATTGGALLMLLVGLVPEVGAALGGTVAVLTSMVPPVMATAIAAVVAALAGLGPEVAIVAGVIIATLLLILLEMGWISTQLEYYKLMFPETMADGVCIEHADFAIAVLAWILSGEMQATPSLLPIVRP